MNSATWHPRLAVPPHPYLAHILVRSSRLPGAILHPRHCCSLQKRLQSHKHFNLWPRKNHSKKITGKSRKAEKLESPAPQNNLLCHAILHSSHVQLFCNPMDYSKPGSSVHEIFQARGLQQVAIPFSRGSSWPRDWIRVSWIGRRILLRLRHQGSLKKEYLLNKLMQTQDLLWGVGIDCAFASTLAAYIYI